MRPPVVGITGVARAGKDTVARFILSKFGGYRYAFADPLRAMLRAGFNIDLDDPYWADRKEFEIAVLGKSPRQMLQTLGTEWGRELVNPNVWIILAADTLRTRGPGMVITDVRFDNEAKWVRRNRGVLIHVLRKTAAPVAAHSSEGGVQLLDEDLVLNNDGDIADLQEKVSRLNVLQA